MSEPYLTIERELPPPSSGTLVTSVDRELVFTREGILVMRSHSSPGDKISAFLAHSPDDLGRSIEFFGAFLECLEALQGDGE